MRYIAPYGISDPNGAYINGDSRLGIQGSIPPAEAFEHPMRELVALIEASGFTPSEDDLEQVLKAVRSQRVNYAVDTGSVNVYSVAFDPPFVALNLGLPIRVLVAHTNTGPSTITVNNLGPYSVRRADLSLLQANDLLAGEVVGLVFDGTYFQIVNFIGTTATTQNNNYFDINIPYTVDTSVTPNTITAPFNPAITQIDAGDLILVKIANANTGATTITVNALPTKNLKSSKLTNLLVNQIVPGMIAVMVYDGTQFQLINPAAPEPVSGVTAQIAKRFMYQDPNYHITTVYNSYVEAFRVTYVPVAAGNKLHVQVAGAFFSQSSDPEMARAVNGFIAYSTNGGSTWNPPSWPGRDFPATGSFMANPAMTELGESGSGGLKSMYFNFNITSELTIPAGPPASVIVRLMFSSASSLAPDAGVLGGTIVDFTEYTL